EPTGQLDALERAESRMRAKRWPEAAAAWQQVVDVNPHLGMAWENLGMAYYRAKNYHKAIPALTRSLELRAGYPSIASYSIPCSPALLGEKDQALEWLQKALDRGFRSLRHIQQDDDLRSLRDDDRFQKMAAVVDIGRLSRDEGRRFDLDLLAREIKRCHYAPF